MELAHVCRNTKGTLTQVVGLNASSARTARETGLAYETGAPTPAQEHVAREPLATW